MHRPTDWPQVDGRLEGLHPGWHDLVGQPRFDGGVVGVVLADGGLDDAHRGVIPWMEALKVMLTRFLLSPSTLGPYRMVSLSKVTSIPMWTVFSAG